MEQKTQPPEGTTHYRFSPFGYDYFYKVEHKDGCTTWWLWVNGWERYNLAQHDPDIWPIQCRHNGYACGQLKHALETLVMFTKPTKSNAAALNNAHQVLAELEGRS